MKNFAVIASVLLIILILGFVSLAFRFLGLWFQAYVSGTPIPLTTIIGMSLRKIPPSVIVNARINSFKAGIKDVTVSDMETHYLAGGKVHEVVRALIAAGKANIDLTWKQATAIDLAGRNILEAVRTSVNPKVIDCPSEDGRWISAIAKNGVELLCKARVTVRTNILQLVGGATEETIIARVGEGIVNSIGQAETHLHVLEAPQKISELVLHRGLDSQTAYVILSIDIADITVGENVGAKLRERWAESEERVAQAEAEKRRAMAIAEQQEKKADVLDMKARLVQAEAEIPKAIAQALADGNLGVMQYYELKNMQADTQMRKAFSSESAAKNDDSQA